MQVYFSLPLVISTQGFLISLISQRHSHSCCWQGRRLAVAVLAVLGNKDRESGRRFVDPKYPEFMFKQIMEVI